MGKQKIAILGGGVGGMTAAWALTSQPGWQDRYEITVYQMGWRLGGKGASGRGPDGRIQEHGLHIWLGFYENAFRTMRAAFEELKGEEAVFTSVDDAFEAHNLIGVMEQVSDAWHPFIIDFPPRSGAPGDGQPMHYNTIWEIMVDGLEVVADWVEREFEGIEETNRDTTSLRRESRGGALQSVLHQIEEELRKTGSEIAGEIEHLLGDEERSLLHMAAGVAKRLPKDWSDHQTYQHDLLFKFLEEALEALKRAVEKLSWTHDGARRAFIVADLTVATMRGLLDKREQIDTDGLGVFDDLDFQEFFQRYGASELSSSVASSGPVRGFYDLVFAYEDGHPDRPNFAAGVALRSAICILMLYKKAIFMKMRAGMGDTIFAPLHKALVKRGVTFKFFHRLENLELGEADGQAAVTRLRFNVQATVRSGDYQPYVRVGELDCWPQAPLTEQLVEGDEILKGPDGGGKECWNGNWKGYDLEDFWTTWEGVGTEDLTLGDGFHQVILAIPPASHPFVCPDFIARNPRWKEMVEKVASVRTQAMQLWLHSELKELGWKHGSAVIDAFLQPMNTWADMTHLIDRETWPISASPATLAYFCGPMVGGIPASDKRGVKERAQVEAERTANLWLQTGPGTIWPNGSTDGALDPRELVLGCFSGGEDRMRGQYWRANVSPSERYVLSKKGTTGARIEAAETGCANLFVAGDWTRNGFNAGCVEAAVMSGLRASQAICGAPSDEEIETYW